VYTAVFPVSRGIINGSIARSATRRYLVYSEADYEVFRPAGATRCTDWGEIWHVGPLLRAKFHPSRCNVKFGTEKGTESVPSSVPNFTPIGATVRV